MPAGLLDYVLGFIAPLHCLLCEEPVGAKEALCPACLAGLKARAILRRVRLADGKVLPVASPFRYQGQYRRTIISYKFHGESGYAKPLGWVMAAAAGALSGSFDLITYVPLSSDSKQERGYDQSQLLAKAAGRVLGLRAAPTLKKVRTTQAQHDLLAKERRENIRGAYACGKPLAGKSVLLVDDIITTGSTLADCARALYAAGAKQVCGLCAADVKGAPIKITIERGKSPWIRKKSSGQSGTYWKLSAKTPRGRVWRKPPTG